MYKRITTIFLIGIQFYAIGQNSPDISVQAQDRSMQVFTEKLSEIYEVYKLKAASDIPITAIGTG